jgi:hypothetical protein
VTTYRLFGRIVAADFPLYLPEASGSPDLTYHLSRLRTQPNELPDGETLLDYQDRGKRWSAVSRDAQGGLLFRFYGLGDIRISAVRDNVEIAILDDADPGMAAVLATGAVPSLLSDLAGTPVLHASAVTGRDGTTIAFLGRSGQGKSTLATLLCLGGGELLTDDVLPVLGRKPVTVGCGPSEVRLREQARDLVRRDLAPTRTSADGRNVVTLRSVDTGQAPRRLDAVFVPLPNREGLLEILRISKREAHLTVLRYPRLPGWKDPQVLRAQFELASSLADQVPVFLARVPWGPPFRSDISPTVWDAARRPEKVARFSSPAQTSLSPK